MSAANNISKDQIMTDKSIPSPASVDSVMNLAYEWASRKVLQAQNRPHASVLGALSDLRAEVSRLATGRAEALDGWVLAPAWRGYALLGTRNYLLNHSAAPPDPELGAEFFITFASEADKSGNRQVGESRDTDLESGPIEAKDMVLRIGFTCPEAVDALTDQLALMRKENFPDAPPTAPSASQPDQAPKAIPMAAEFQPENLR